MKVLSRRVSLSHAWQYDCEKSSCRNHAEPEVRRCSKILKVEIKIKNCLWPKKRHVTCLASSDFIWESFNLHFQPPSSVWLFELASFLTHTHLAKTDLTEIFRLMKKFEWSPNFTLIHSTVRSSVVLITNDTKIWPVLLETKPTESCKKRI